jgi:hypothetical protein
MLAQLAILLGLVGFGVAFYSHSAWLGIAAAAACWIIMPQRDI